MMTLEQTNFEGYSNQICRHDELVSSITVNNQCTYEWCDAMMDDDMLKLQYKVKHCTREVRLDSIATAPYFFILEMLNFNTWNLFLARDTKLVATRDEHERE